MPVLYPERQLLVNRSPEKARYTAGTRTRQIPEAHWPDLVERARSEGLRSIARDFDVSHETVRAVLKLARN